MHPPPAADERQIENSSQSLPPPNIPLPTVVLWLETKKLSDVIKEINRAPENVAAFRFSGKVTTKDYEVLNPILKRHKTKYGDIRLYIEMIDFEWDTIKAMWEDLKTDLRFMTDISKIAFVTDKEWLKKSIQLVAFFSPINKYKIFESGHRDEAFEWLEDESLKTSQNWLPLATGVAAFVGIVVYTFRRRG